MQRTGHECPVCGGPCQPPVIRGDGDDRVEYLHTDLVNLKEYCVVYPDGQTEEVQEATSNVERLQ